MKLGKVPKIYIGWISIIAVGLGGFVLARNSVTKNRYRIMKTREKIRDQARAEQEEQRVS
ncbi:hypothetical protein ACOMHN_015672 [Nucella lapillus]